MKIYHLFIFLFLFSIYSCDRKDGEGFISPEFDSTPHIFSKVAVDTIIIVAKKDIGWWFTDLSIDNGQSFNEDSMIVQKKNGSVYKFEYEWFTIEKLDNKRIHIILKENNTEKKRTLSFVALAVNASSKVSLLQNK